MTDKIDILLRGTERAGPRGLDRGRRGPGPDGVGFGDELQRALQGEVRLSAHAADRIRTRGIPMDRDTMDRLELGFRLLGEKGGRDGLILMDRSVFLVNVPNRTVVTALGLDEPGVTATGRGGRVFTNIDSAIFV